MDSLFWGIGNMDWKECKDNKLVKEVNIDHNLIASLLKSADKKLKSQSMLPLDETTASSKVTLTYDALREYLEAISIENNFKIYNHECYCSFLKEILDESELGTIFNEFRKVRNSINYYGKDISIDEAEPLIKDMIEFIEKVKHRKKS